MEDPDKKYSSVGLPYKEAQRSGFSFDDSRRNWGDAETGTRYGYGPSIYNLTPEQQKKIILEESDPDILKRDGFEKVFERFLNAEPPNYKALRVARKEASDKEKASWKDFDPKKIRPEGEFDKSRTVYYPGGGYSIPAFENPYVLPTAQQIADREASNKAFKALNAYDVNDYRSYQDSYRDKLNTPTVDTKDFEKLITNEKPSTPTSTPTPNTKDFETLLAQNESYETQAARKLMDEAWKKASRTNQLSDYEAYNVALKQFKATNNSNASSNTQTPAPTPTPTPPPTPDIKDFETLLAQNQGPSSPIKYYEDLNKGKGGYAPDPGAGRPGNVRLKNPPLASDTQEVNIAAGDKDPFLNKAEQLLGDLKASKDAKAAEIREIKRNESGNLAQTTELLKNLNFFGDDESSGDASLIAAEYRPTPVPEPPDRLSPNMRGARNYNRENPGKYNPFLPDNVNRHFMGLPPA